MKPLQHRSGELFMDCLRRSIEISKFSAAQQLEMSNQIRYYQPEMAKFISEFTATLNQDQCLEVNRLFYAIWDYYKPYLLECKGHLTAEHIAFYQKRNLDLARYTSTESSFIEQKKVVQADLGHLYAMDLMTTLYYRMQVSPQIRSIPIQYWAQLQMSVKSFLDGLEAFIMENAQTV